MKHITLQWTSHAHEFLTILVTPDFSPVLRALREFSRFNGFGRIIKPLERLEHLRFILHLAEARC